MKGRIIIFFFTLSAFGYGQTYQLLPDSCTFCYYQYTQGGSTFYSRNYLVDPSLDTTFLGNNYTRVLYSGGSFSPRQPFGIRQSGNKLFGVVHDSINEYLIMDFDAVVGDTITNLYSDGKFYDATVTIKDSTLIGGSFYHHWMELLGDTVYGNSDFQGWVFRWQERTICNTQPASSGLDGNPYGGINYNLPWNYQLLGSAYVNVKYCTGDLSFTNSPDVYCNQCALSTNSLEELSLGEVELLKIIDLMGRETDDKPNTVLIYIFSDGTSEKVFRLE